MKKINYISPTLLNAWLYLVNTESADINDFMSVLRREPHETTEAQQKGIEFEKECYRGEKDNYNQYIKGGYYQVRVKKYYKDILILGIIDVLQPDVIYDIKTTGSYKLGKYYKTSQHLIYPFCTGIKHFAYLVNKDCIKEDYYYKDGQCEELIDSFINWLERTNLINEWKKHWYKTESEVLEKW